MQMLTFIILSPRRNNFSVVAAEYSPKDITDSISHERYQFTDDSVTEYCTVTYYVPVRHYVARLLLCLL